MTTTLRLVLFSALCGFATLAVRADDYAFAEKFERAHPFQSNGEITLSNVNGSVTIRTWDRAEIRIDGEKRAKTEEELKLIAVNIDLTDTRLSLKTEFPKRGGFFAFGNHVRGHVTLTVTIPATARLRDIGTVNGSIVIEDARGPVRAHSINGRVTARGLANEASLETVNGTINADFSAVSRGQKISAKTVNGSATLAFPSDASLAIKGRSVNGSITCDFPIRLEGKASRTGLTGTVGDGAAALEASTVNGSIRVKQR